MSPAQEKAPLAAVVSPNFTIMFGERPVPMIST
jgi:hypothetical protein